MNCDGCFVHVMNRRVDRQCLFQNVHDYEEFSSIIGWYQEQFSLEITAWCLMPNHWHLIVKPVTTLQLSKCMHGIQSTHAISIRRRTETSGEGAIYGQRFKGFCIHFDRLLKTVVYVERNPVKAGLVQNATAWPFSSAKKLIHQFQSPRVLRLPLELERHRTKLLMEPLSEEFELAFKQSIRRGSLLEACGNDMEDLEIKKNPGKAITITKYLVETKVSKMLVSKAKMRGGE